MKFKILAVLTFLAATIWAAGNASAQNPQSMPAPSSNSPQGSSMDQDIQLLRKDLRSQRKQIIAANLPLTDTEAEKFWPLYDQFTAEAAKIGDSRSALVMDYAQNYSSMTDAQAQSLLTRSLNLDQATAQLRQKYVPIFEKVLSAKKTALFFQMDKRLALLTELQLASQIPMMQP